ncbi:MAG: VWA domain-containing protein [Bacteroidia bacterium]|nr:VWA domain-containing protein [Bacteroidia bacterium]MDW8015037.1 VWA domain-containing protein [Bacteroidia bacterium]
MNFLYPTFLWGLTALVIPLIVHFFYLRRAKKYEFSQAALVERLRQASRPYLRFRHWLLLLLRMALITAIVFLFARPTAAEALSVGEGASVVVVWDVSPSMTPVHEQAKALLLEVLRRSPPSHEYRLLTTESFLPKGDFVSARLLMDKVSKIIPASLGYPITQLLEKAEFLFSGARYPVRKVYILSDFQSSSVGELSRLQAGAIDEIVLLPVPFSLKGNAYIDSLTAIQVGGGWRLGYRLIGEAGRLYTLRIGEKSYSVLPGAYEEILPSSSFVELHIEGDGLPFDNQVSAGLWESQAGGIGWLAPLWQPFQRLHALLGLEPWQGTGSPPWDKLSVSVATFSTLPEGVEAWVAAGGTLILFPSAPLSPAAWSKLFLSSEVTFLGEAIPASPLALEPQGGAFWQEVFLPAPDRPSFLAEPMAVRLLYQFQPKTGQVLLRDEQGRPLLWEMPWGKGRIYLFAFPWEHSTLGAHSLFVPLFARLYRWGQEAHHVWATSAGRKSTFSVAAEGRPHLRHRTTGTEYIPPVEKKGTLWQMSFGEQPLPLGLYEVYSGNQVYGYLGLNVSIQESADPPLSLEAWKQVGIPVRIVEWKDNTFQEKADTFSWRSWHIWLIIVLLLIVAETYWARRLLQLATVPSPRSVA